MEGIWQAFWMLILAALIIGLPTVLFVVLILAVV